MVNVADGTNVNVGFASVEFSFSHNKSSNIFKIKNDNLSDFFGRSYLSFFMT